VARRLQHAGVSAQRDAPHELQLTRLSSAGQLQGSNTSAGWAFWGAAPSRENV